MALDSATTTTEGAPSLSEHVSPWEKVLRKKNRLFHRRKAQHCIALRSRREEQKHGLLWVLSWSLLTLQSCGQRDRHYQFYRVLRGSGDVFRFSHGRRNFPSYSLEKYSTKRQRVRETRMVSLCLRRRHITCKKKAGWEGDAFSLFRISTLECGGQLMEGQSALVKPYIHYTCDKWPKWDLPTTSTSAV